MAKLDSLFRISIHSSEPTDGCHQSVRNWGETEGSWRSRVKDPRPRAYIFFPRCEGFFSSRIKNSRREREVASGEVKSCWWMWWGITSFPRKYTNPPYVETSVVFRRVVLVYRRLPGGMSGQHSSAGGIDGMIVVRPIYPVSWRCHDQRWRLCSCLQECRFHQSSPDRGVGHWRRGRRRGDGLSPAGRTRRRSFISRCL